MSKRTIAAVSITAVFISILFAVSSLAGAQQECPSPQLIDTITGNGDQQSPPFDTTTNLFRISYDVQADRPTAPFLIYVKSSDNPDGASVGNVTAQGSQSGEGFINAEPGRYFLDITSLGTQYTIKIESCASGGQATPGEGTNVQGATKAKSAAPPKSTTAPAQPAPPAQPKATPQPVPQPPPSPGPLLNAGGPKDGPVPKMPGGGCPHHFPTISGNACYRR